MRLPLAVAAIAAGAVALGGSGADGDHFTRRGEEICRRMAREAEAVPRPAVTLAPVGTAARRRLERYDSRIKRIVGRRLAELRRLDPPPRLQAERDRLFRELDALAHVSRRLNRVSLTMERALKSGDRREGARAGGSFERLVSAMRRRSARIERSMRAVGWPSCTKAL